MAALLLWLLAAQAPACGPDAAALRAAGARAAEELDIAAAVVSFDAAAAQGCGEAGIASWYLRGWQAARDAYREGGAESALLPVRSAAAKLEDLAAAGWRSAEIARAVLLAAAAAAQSERDEMAVLLGHALALESVQLGADRAGALVPTAHEAAGDLWLQVHRFDEAGRAYAQAREMVGATPRVTLGLARLAARVRDVRSACDEYQAFVRWWGARTRDAAEIAEARSAIRDLACTAPAPARE